MRPKLDKKESSDEFPVKVDDEIYGPIPFERIISDVMNGELTDDARFWDGKDWVPVSILLRDRVEKDNEWLNSEKKEFLENGPPLPASSAWRDIKRKGRWLMIYGDHLVIEGGNINSKDLGKIIEGNPRTGGIPLKKLLNVNFKELNDCVEIKASSFHKMYEVYTLECSLSKNDSEELMKELMDAKVRILNN